MSHNIRIATNLRKHFLFGANTDVGKTVVSAGLARVAAAATTTADDASVASRVHYIKPLQCGGSDEAFVERYARLPSPKHLETLFSWELPASPHTASRKENAPISDQQVMEALQSSLSTIESSYNDNDDSNTTTNNNNINNNTVVTWIETAGGVLSPSSASPHNCSPRHARGNSDVANGCTYSLQNKNDSWGWTTQADLYQPLASFTSTVLVGDGRLGGISATLSALEVLLLRGYQVAGIVLLDTNTGIDGNCEGGRGSYDNGSALREYVASRKGPTRATTRTSSQHELLFSNALPTASSIVTLPSLPPYPDPLEEWYESAPVKETLEGLNESLAEHWSSRVVAPIQDMQSNNDNGNSNGNNDNNGGKNQPLLWWPDLSISNESSSSSSSSISKSTNTNDNGDEASPLASATEYARLWNMRKQAIDRLRRG